MNKEDKPLIPPEDENVDAKFAREMTKLNFEKAYVDIYSQIIAEITHKKVKGWNGSNLHLEDKQ